MTTTIVTNGDYVINTGANHQLSVVGNITTTGYIFGNGSQLVGVAGGNSGGTAFALVNGITNLTTQPGGVANLTIGSSPNVVVWQTTGEYVTGVVSATGNITGSYILGNGSQLTGLAATYGNANVVANLAALGSNPVSTTGNITGGNLSAVGGVYTPGVVSASGNVRGGNINTAGVITATGNITGNCFIGNGSQLTAMYGNANVVANLAALETNPISTSGNITGNFFIGNGSLLTGLPATYGNANVVANLAALGTNPVSTTGNISGSFFLGNGSQLTGLPATYGNANVAANLAAVGSNPVSTTGNITGSNLLTGGLISATGNITSGNLLTGGLISATGNITGGNFIGNVVGGGAGTPTISSTTNLDLSAVSAVRIVGGGTFRLPSLSTAQIANVIAANGDMVYNSTTAKIQAYAAGAWGNITLS